MQIAISSILTTNRLHSAAQKQCENIHIIPLSVNSRQKGKAAACTIFCDQFALPR